MILKKYNNFSHRRVFVVAEAGVNHNGKLSVACRLVDAAKEAGCDAVKFQTFKAENLVSSKAQLAEYQKKNGSRATKNQFDLIKQLELSFEEFKRVKIYCDQKKITFLSTPFDHESADFLEQLKVPIFKISSGEVTNAPFLRYIASKDKDIFLSTGMADIQEVSEAVKTIYQAGNKKLVLLHCVTEYPAPYKSVNLKAILTLAETFKIPVGFSDHTMGIEASIAAVALGAVVIEKHLTLNRRFSGPDHQASLLPGEFKKLVSSIRNIEKALGDGIKQPAHVEKKYIRLVRKSLVAAQDIVQGQFISDKDIVIKRPGYGIPPKDLNKVTGLKARRKIRKDDVLTWKQLV